MKQFKFTIDKKELLLIDVQDNVIINGSIIYENVKYISPYKLSEIDNETSIELYGIGIDDLYEIFNESKLYIYINPFKHPSDIYIQPASMNWYNDTINEWNKGELMTYKIPVILTKQSS